MGTTSTPSATRADFEMYTPAGDAAVGALVAQLVTLAASASPQLVIEAARSGMAEVARTHPEVHDTEPRGHIAHAIEEAFAAQGAQLSEVTWQL